MVSLGIVVSDIGEGLCGGGVERGRGGGREDEKRRRL